MGSLFIEMTEEEVFSFLDSLRISNEVNMLGARPYIKEAFPNLSDEETRELHNKWMKTFHERHKND